MLQLWAEILLKLPLQTPGVTVGCDEEVDSVVEGGRVVVVEGGGGAEVVVVRSVVELETERDDEAVTLGPWPGRHWKYPASHHEPLD